MTSEEDQDSSPPGSRLPLPRDEMLRLYERYRRPGFEKLPIAAAVGVGMLDAGRQEDGEAYLRDLAIQEGLFAAALLGRALERRGAPAEEVLAWYERERSRIADQNQDQWSQDAFDLGLAFHALGDDEAALRWYREAAELDHLDGMNNYGALLRQMDRPDEAEPWLKRAAAAGNEAAAENLRRTLWKRGVRPGDIGWAEEALWFTPDAEAGQAKAVIWLWLAARNSGRDELTEHWELRAAQLGNTGAMWARGVRLGRRKEHDEALPWLQHLGRPSAHDAEVRRVSTWDECPAPESEGVHALHTRMGQAFEALESHMTRAGRVEEFTELFDTVQSRVAALASRTVTPTDDVWDPRTMAVNTAAYVGALVACHQAFNRPVPEALAELWAWVARGHHPCGYEWAEHEGEPERNAEVSRTGPLVVF